ncbi:hypothetical protein WBJ53_30575 [Spirosoma sp. SC4-14]|uniref:hypothetical protein n=1 Tax=Spirosoma sp. SC4-14 TaxID=3128900 RepID=UPI0030CD44A4
MLLTSAKTSGKEKVQLRLTIANSNKMIALFRKLTTPQKVALLTSLIGGFSLILSSIISRPKESAPKIANVKLIQFAINTDLSNFIEVYNEVHSETNEETIETRQKNESESNYYNEEINKAFEEISKIETIEKTEIININRSNNEDSTKSKNPIFDITFNNSGDENTILKKIKITIIYLQPDQGDGAPSEPSSVVNSLYKYVIDIPDLPSMESPGISKEEFQEMFGQYQRQLDHYRKTGNFIVEKNALPPILLKFNDPARIQLELVSDVGIASTYILVTEFIFSNGQTLKKPVFMYF